MISFRLREFRYALNKISNSTPEEFKISVTCSQHFIERLSERHELGYNGGSLDVINQVDKHLPLILYYLNLGGLLPERGMIEFGKYQIRGNVIDGVYHMNTFINKELDEI